MPGGVPAVVREWYEAGGDLRAAEVSDNLFTPVGGFGDGVAGRFLDEGLLLVATDSQCCVRWVVEVAAVQEDPPVFLVGPEDYRGVGRTRFAESFSAFVFTTVWDGRLWRGGDSSVDFDHVLPAGALAELGSWLTVLPVTWGWAGNQRCEAVHRFDGDARVAVAVSGGVAVWSVVRARAGPVRERFSGLIGAG